MFDQTAVHSALTWLALELAEHECDPTMDRLEAIVYTFVAKLNRLEEELDTPNRDRYVFTAQLAQRHCVEMFTQLRSQLMPGLDKEFADIAAMLAEHEVAVFTEDRASYAARDLTYEAIVAALKRVFSA